VVSPSPSNRSLSQVSGVSNKFLLLSVSYLNFSLLPFGEFHLVVQVQVLHPWPDVRSAGAAELGDED
jgi:hypothetical protein